MTKEEFINKLNKSEDKLSIIKKIKSIRDVGLRNYVELTNILCKYLSKEEIFKVIIGEKSKKYEFERVDKLKLLLSLRNEDILIFIKENRDWIKENDINISDIIIRMNTNQKFRGHIW